MLKDHDGTAHNPVTFSVVARDPRTGEIGVASASRWPAVGCVVPWLEAGVGAAVTQSFTNVDLGPECLAGVRAGRAPGEVLAELLAADPGRELRQVGLVDVSGRVAVHTGSGCVAAAGHAVGQDVGVLGNTLAHDGICDRMLDAFAAAGGELAERLLAALRAGEEAGGDLRGRQSAALAVAPGRPEVRPWGRRFDLRVDDAAQPIDEIARLLRIARAYEALDLALEAADAGDLGATLTGTTSAYELAPEDAQVGFWHAMALTISGRTDEARPILTAALAAEPRLVEAGLRTTDAGHRVVFAAVLRSLLAPD